MYEVSDTIAAISSPPGVGTRAIIRLSGPGTLEILKRIVIGRLHTVRRGVVQAALRIDDELQIDAKLYLFLRPHSYTGDDLAEIHVYTNSAVLEGIVKQLYDLGARAAGPGEFTARAYLNGKIDLAQAEAVAEVVAGSNKFQLAAAGRLLAGRLGETVTEIRCDMLDVISLIEAGLDFSTQDIEFITTGRATERIEKIRIKLEAVLAGGIYDELTIDMPAVGIAGACNAGKSSLLNALLGQDRSLVSEQKATTRDVLTGILQLKNFDCVLFDCAGLTEQPAGILDELAQAAATEALNSASVVILCIDVSKKDYGNDIGVLELIRASQLIPVATKCDCLSAEKLNKKIARLSPLVPGQLTPTSAKTSRGLGRLRSVLDETLTHLRKASSESADRIAITQRHRQVVEEAIENLSEAVNELENDSEEVASMLLRASWRALANIQRERIDDAILQRIFSRFCIGK